MGKRGRGALAALAAAVVLLAGCGAGQVGERQVFNPNQTVGQSQEEEPTGWPGTTTS